MGDTILKWAVLTKFSHIVAIQNKQRQKMHTQLEFKSSLSFIGILIRSNFLFVTTRDVKVTSSTHSYLGNVFRFQSYFYTSEGVRLMYSVTAFIHGYFFEFSVKYFRS